METISQALQRKASLVQKGGVRAAVLGVNDGLISTVCLVIGVAATGAEAVAVLTAGFAGLLAGALSMAAGEWISVRAQVELFEGILLNLKKAMRRDKPGLIRTLAHTMASHGVEEKTAYRAAEDMSKKRGDFLAMYSAQVIGMNKDELGSPWRAAASSFVLFAAGSFVPLLPWILGAKEMIGIIASVTLTLLASVVVGGYIAHSSEKSIAYGAARQLLIVVVAAAVTYGIGHAFGVAIG